MKNKNNDSKKIKVIELFAGVGGFRLGLEASQRNSWGYQVVWSNQWEPATKGQHASDTYVRRFGKDNHSNQDIAKIPTAEIPDHDLLVGGFPCQDYSVARVLSHAKGLAGKKGVLWWQIHRILDEKGNKRPNYLMLENVDRLLKSPVKRRGRDFAIMLASLSDLGYAVEWRIVNAGDYGMPQRRRRIFILGYKKGSPIYKDLLASKPSRWILKEGTIAKAFPIVEVDASPTEVPLTGTLAELTNNTKLFSSNSPFLNSGVMIDRKVYTQRVEPAYDGPRINLENRLLNEDEVPEEFFISKKDLPKWKYLKGAKDEIRGKENGFTFHYKEGPIAFPDSLDKPSRTIITGEGGPTPSRFKHVIKTPSGRYRRLTPVELERLCMFPDNHTEGNSDIKQAFFMGNALVVGVIKKLGDSLLRQHSTSPRGNRKEQKLKPVRMSKKEVALV